MSTAAPKLRLRDRQPELMDQPGLPGNLHAHALVSLRRINRVSRVAASVWRPIRELAREPGAPRPLRVLDVACGGGDIVRDLIRRAGRERLDLRVDGCDISRFAVEFAQSAAAREGTAAEFFECDVLSAPLPDDYDVVICTLFLHHLNEADAERLLANMARAARRMVVVSDLRRTRIGYWMAHLACNVLTRSPIVRVDGPLSVAAAFSTEEVVALAGRAGLADARLTREWPQRYLLTWSRS